MYVRVWLPRDTAGFEGMVTVVLVPDANDKARPQPVVETGWLIGPEYCAD